MPRDFREFPNTKHACINTMPSCYKQYDKKTSVSGLVSCPLFVWLLAKRLLDTTVTRTENV